MYNRPGILELMGVATYSRYRRFVFTH